MEVMRGSFFPAHWGPAFSASMRMVRSFQIQKRRPYWPMRSWV